MWWWKIVPFSRKILYRRSVAAREMQALARQDAAAHRPSIQRILDAAEEREQKERNAAVARILNQARKLR